MAQRNDHTHGCRSWATCQPIGSPFYILVSSKVSSGDSEDGCLIGVLGRVSEMMHIELSSVWAHHKGESLLATKAETAASPARR